MRIPLMPATRVRQSGPSSIGPASRLDRTLRPRRLQSAQHSAMRTSKPLLVTLVCGTALAYVETLYAGPLPQARSKLAMGTLAALSAIPEMISFGASSPDLGEVSGSSAGSLGWMVRGGYH